MCKISYECIQVCVCVENIGRCNDPTLISVLFGTVASLIESFSNWKHMGISNIEFLVVWDIRGDR